MPPKNAPPVKAPAKTLRLVLGDQLSHDITTLTVAFNLCDLGVKPLIDFTNMLL